jgi:hypothetical protein
MDILSWTKLNPNIRVCSVNKRFYNQYYYKLEVSVTGSGFLRKPELTIESQADARKLHNQVRKVNFGGSWRHNCIRDPNAQDIEILNKISHARGKHPDLKLRVEEPSLQIYSVDEDSLYKFAAEITHSNNQHLVSIGKPLTPEHLALLEKGFTISSKLTDYPIKVHIREGRYGLQTKQQILNYLQNVPEEVHLPDHFVSSFSKEFESVWNCYFYAKDRSILTMVALICPSLVRAVEEYHLSPDDK